MPRQPGTTDVVLTIKKSELQELKQHCGDVEDAAEKWLARLFFRYGMRHAEEAIRESTALSADAIRTRRGATSLSSSEPQLRRER